MTGRTFQPHIITDDSASGGLRVEGSYKFDSSRANYIERVPTVDGNRRTWTYSAWVKFCDKDGSGEVLISGVMEVVHIVMMLEWDYILILV